MQTLYYLIIYPIELILETVFSIANRAIENPGISIIAVSLVMNFMIMPMYKKADELQEKERDIQKRMDKWVTHINKTFHGDERFMMIQTYYRENHYKPVYAFRGSLSLLLQIPFFIAAYHFLSTLGLLKGAPFWLIRDLSLPDAMLSIGSLKVNVLPFVMTGANFISCFIYSKGFKLKEKIQLYGMAVIFLIFLYPSPSGLVLYWTCNNLFSLGKNIVMKGSGRKEKEAEAEEKIRREAEAVHPYSYKRYFLGALLMTVLTGIMIPSSVINASPSEFVNVASYVNPLKIILYTTCISAGVFLVWGGILYSLFSEKTKVFIEKLVLILCVLGLIHFMLFGRDLGNLTADMVFDNVPVYPVSQIAVSWVIVAAVAGLVFVLWKYINKVVPIALLALTISVGAVAVQNFVQTNRQLSEMDYLQEAGNSQSKDEKIIRLSKNGKNVIMLMMDRAINGYIPYIFNENPDLYKQFDGFTYYPCTLSFGMVTNYGVPALYGGYEYSPAEMNARKDEPLEKKHNEALKVMPTLFAEKGYDVTVCDPAYAGYQDVPDLSIFDDIEGVHAYNTMGHYNENSELYGREEKLRRRNLFCYSLFKVMPVGLQTAYYDHGNYCGTMSDETDLNLSFEDTYSVLKSLTKITDVSEDSENAFVMLDNETPHRPYPLQLPDYTEAEHIDNTPYLEEWSQQFKDENGNDLVHMDTEKQQNHYFANAAMIRVLGEWFAFLQKEGIYDNTRIIIVSDHGFPLGQFDDLIFRNISETPFDVQGVNPLLMVKDFGASGFTVDDTFMTNADVPTIAVKDIISDPVNPYTGKKINSDAKNGPLFVSTSNNWTVSTNHGNTFKTTKENEDTLATWYQVTGNMFDEKNWKDIGFESPK